MKKTILILAFILLIGIIFSGCLQPKPIPGPEPKEKEIIPVEQKNETEDKEIDSLFEEELINLPDQDLTGLEEELV